jgi:acyl-CoA thioesterase-1
MVRGFFGLVVSLMALGIVLVAPPAHAQARIVALGASNTNGKGVSTQDAFPAQIQAMLQAKGISAQVSVSASDGENSAKLLGRVDSIPADTKLVLIEPVRANDQRDGIAGQNASNLAQIGARLRARGIKSIIVLLRPLPSGGLQADNVHLTPAGHRAIAARYLPQIIAALQSR